MNKDMKTNIVIADDHKLFVTGLTSLIQQMASENYEVVGAVHNGQELMDWLKLNKADLCLLDLNMPERDGMSVIQPIKQIYPTVRILVLSMYAEHKLVKRVFEHGVDGYVLKEKGPEELFYGMRAVVNGERYLGAGVSLVPQQRSPKSEEVRDIYEDKFIRKHHLTKREIEVLLLISQALSNKQIAQHLYISDQTVSVHRKNLMRKLGVSNTAGLIKFAFDRHII